MAAKCEAAAAPINAHTIWLLYCNTLRNISQHLEPHLQAVKEEAVKYYQLGIHQGMLEESAIRSAESIQSLLQQMSVPSMWDNTRFLTKAAGVIPPSAPERETVKLILSYYNLHLFFYKRATQLKASESKEERKALSEVTKMHMNISLSTASNTFMSEDYCQYLARLLSECLGIPEEKMSFDHFYLDCNGKNIHN